MTNHFPLLRRLSITSLLAMLVTAAILIFLYRQDQVTEHENIAEQENEKTAIHLTHLLDDRITTLISATEGLDTQSLRVNPNIGLFATALETVREHHVVKLKIFNLSGITVFSSVTEEIGMTSKHPDWLAKALRGEVPHKLEFRKTFISPSGELHDRYIANTYMPLTHAGKRIGAIELYADATPIIERIYSKTIEIALVVLGAFTALYAALFFSVRSADLALATDTLNLTQSETRLRATISTALDAIISIDSTSRLIDFNPAAENAFGWKKEEVIGQSMAELLIPERYRDRHQRGLARYIQTGETLMLNRRIEITALRRDGAEFPVELTISPIREDGRIIFTAYIRDITERKQIEAEQRIAAVAFESQECIVVTDAATVILRVNRTFIESTGYTAEEAIGKKMDLLKSDRQDAAFYDAMWACIRSTGSWRGEIWNRRKNGEVYLDWLVITAVKGTDGTITNYVGTLTDITERKVAEKQIHNLAFYDTLTQLPNRRLLVDRLNHALVSNLRNKRQGALLFIDLDNFKILNDLHGHDTGDLLLIEAAARLKACIREDDTAARLGGDEFVVLLEDLDPDEPTAATQAEAVGEKILLALGQPYLLDSHEYNSTASIGATLLRGPLRTTDEMLRRADVGLYQAKAGGRNTLRFFDPALQALVRARVALEADLRRAVSFNTISGQEQFLLYYQPQVDSSGRLVGAEALVRWQHSERGMVSPAEFIPLAEETGLILPLGHWVMATACQQLASWAAQPEMAHLTVAVNVSARQFSLPSFVEEVLALVEHFGTNPEKLKLEITESMLLDNVEDIIAKITALKTRGINFSLDDFGTGYSSLSYLKRLPLHQLKIDQSFVRDVFTDSNDAAIAKTIILLAKSMGLEVIAEGVETEAQRTLLELNGCHAFQGYLFSKPVPVTEFERLVTKFA